MIAAPMGLPGRLVIDALVRMAKGQNALNEVNTVFGEWTHADGWGAVYEDQGRLQIQRSLAACWDDPSIEKLRDRRVFLLHARKASVGGVTLEDTHPFEREIDGARWFFCHNGTVRDPLPAPLAPTQGNTDSEGLFHLLLPHLHQGSVLTGLREVCSGILNFTSLNCFLLGPSDLWAACLHTANPVYYTLTLTETDAGPVVSSEPLDELAGSKTALSRGTVVQIDRATGTIELESFIDERCDPSAAHPRQS